jgi:radical SAM protein with 4Fe4S-binding SPASM domain
MQKSKFLQQVGDENNALFFHSLLGNLFLLNQEYIAVLNSFRSPRDITEEDNPTIIQELVEARYLVDEDEDERKLLREKNISWLQSFREKKTIRLLDLMISESCNFGCPHCLHSRSVDVTGSHGKKKFMDFETAKKSVDAYYELLWNTDPTLAGNIHFGSAEPLLNWEVLKQTCLYAKEKDPKCLLSMNSNITLFTEEQARFCTENDVYISTSLDGPPEGNDKIRFYKNHGGTFEDIIGKYRLLKSVGHPIDGFSITMNDRNFDSITPEFINWGAEFGCKGIATDIDLINTDNCTKPIGAYVDKLMEIRKACQHHGIENFGSWTAIYENLVNPPEDAMPTFCKAIKGRNLAVNPEGKIFLCGHTTTVIGDISAVDKLFDPEGIFYQTLEKRLPGNDPFCVGCTIEGMCAGQCHITREISTNLKNEKANILCDFYKQVTQRLLERKLEIELNE